MPDVELARREGVELIRTGSWAASTGTWTPTAKDIKAAVEAMKCPAVGKPILKIGHLDKRFTPALDNDGEPGIGWVDNLRAGEDGHVLLGDYVGVPAWIDKVLASAWPKRSIEGKYNYRCALNHRHDFALDAVSLLGTTAPAIPTLRSLNDVAELYGVEIAASEDHSGDSVYAVVAAAEVYMGAMIALIPTVEDAERLAVEGGLPVDQIHLTLAYLGEAAELGARGQQDVIDQVSTVANGLPRLEAEIFAVNVFNPGNANERDTCLVWGVTGDIIDAVHDLVDDTLHLVDAPIPSQHRPWAAHITAAYTDDLSRIGELTSKVGPIAFDRLRLAFAGEFIDIPLMEWPGEEPEPNDDEVVATAAGSAKSLHEYWTAGPGLKKWRGKPHPWTALFKELREHLGADKAKRTASKWYREVFGHMPNQKVKASDGQPSVLDRMERLGYLEPDPTPILPAAEPEPEINPDPKEDLVSTELSGLRSRLGLPDDADLAAIEAKVDAIKADAEKTPEMVAASAAVAEKAKAEAEAATAEKDELRKEVSVLASQVETMSARIAAADAEAAKTVKASVLDTAQRQGKFTPAERGQWETDYDESPGVTTRTLSRIAVGYAVPVMASGVVGDPEPAAANDPIDAEYERLFGETAGA